MSSPRRVLTFCLWLGALPTFWPGHPVEGQSFLLSSRMEAIIPEPGEEIRVRIGYLLLPDPGATDIPLSSLMPGSARLLSCRSAMAGTTAPAGEEGRSPLEEEGFAADDSGIPCALQELRKHYWEGLATIPPGIVGGDTPISLTLVYSVAGAWATDRRASIPLVAVRWPPSDPLPSTFRARVRIPHGFSITELFPTSVLQRPDPGDGGVYEIGLQGIPSMVVLEMVAGDGPLIGLERMLDALVILFLVVMGILGLQYLRRTGR